MPDTVHEIPEAKWDECVTSIVQAANAKMEKLTYTISRIMILLY